MMKQKNRRAVLFLLPVLLAVFCTLFYPFIYSAAISFTNKYFQRIDFRWIGFENYLELFQDQTVVMAFANSVKLTLIVVTGNLLIGLPVALALNRIKRCAPLFRVLLFIPWMIPSIVTATIFKWIFNSYYGYLNYILLKFSLITEPLQMMSDTTLVWWAVSSAIIWGSFPFVTLVLEAALKNIDKDLYGVAKLDGANGFQCFWYITFPNLRSTLVTITILQIIWQISEYDMVKLMTNGGPGKTTYTLSLLMYDEAFHGKRIGYSGAIGLAFFLLMFLFTWGYLHFFKGKEQGDEIGK